MRIFCLILLIIFYSNFVSSDCGERKVRIEGLITNGYVAKHGDWPWHAAIFHMKNKSLAYQCGGTIISEFFILTAAHCTRSNGNLELTPEVVSVQLGKFKLWETSEYTQHHQVFKIIAHAEYNRNNFKNDIALLRLETKIRFDNYIQPACLWDKKDFRITSDVGKIATTLGWGWTESDENVASSVLQVANLPIIGDIECLEKNSKFFGSYIFLGSFCAGLLNGTSVCNGDSGGGLYLNVSNTWFLRGIVSFGRKSFGSTIKCDPKELAGFVNVAYYTEWIENKMKRNVQTNNCDEISIRLTFYEILNENSQEAVDIFLTMKTLPYKHVIEAVYQKGLKNVQKIIKFIKAFPLLEQKLRAGIVLYESMRSKGNLESRAAAKLLAFIENLSTISEKFSLIPDKLKRTTLNVVNELRSHRISFKKCNEYSEVIIKKQTTRIAEYPHMARIGYIDKNRNQTELKWLCSGFLVSPNFIMSAAHCLTKKNYIVSTVRIGDLNIIKGRGGAQPQTIGVEKIFIHPKVNARHLIHDIGLVKLKKNLEMSINFRPACLWTSPTVPHVTLEATGWGVDILGSDNKISADYDERCWEADMRVIGQDECRNYSSEANYKIKSSHVCAIDLSGEVFDCYGISGGALQIKNSTLYGPIYNVVAVISHLIKTSYNSRAINIFTRISSHIDWIESIVWR